MKWLIFTFSAEPVILIGCSYPMIPVLTKPNQLRITLMARTAILTEKFWPACPPWSSKACAKPISRNGSAARRERL